MKIEVKFYNDLTDLIDSFLFCTDKQESISDYILLNNLTIKGKKLLETNILNTDKPHEKPLNMIKIETRVYGFSRACLQELSTHRIDVEKLTKSTRFTLSRIVKEDSINEKTVNKYYYIPENDFISQEERKAWIMDRIRDLNNIKLCKELFSMPNDKLKKYVHDFMLCNTKIVWSATALRNFFNKRLYNPAAWYQIKELAQGIYDNIPAEWKPFFNEKKIKYCLAECGLRKIYGISCSHHECTHIREK